MPETVLIPLDVVKAITGTTDNTVATRQGNAIMEMLEAYLDTVLIKRDVTNERITVPYQLSRLIEPKFNPINSVASLSVITRDGTYKADTQAISIGEYAIELLPRFWFCFARPILPKAVAAVLLSYNVGHFDSWADLPAILQEAALELLKYKYVTSLAAGFQSEHLGDYSYSKGSFVRGLPVEIASMLDGVVL